MLNEEFIVGLVVVLWCSAQEVFMPGRYFVWYASMWGGRGQWGCEYVSGGVSVVGGSSVVISVGIVW